MYQLIFYVPQAHCERVKESLFAAGAGRYPGYDRCAWQTAGQGQFRPLAGSAPAVGHEGKVERVAEMKVEMVCDDDAVAAALDALKAAHPYETPAYALLEINRETR